MADWSLKSWGLDPTQYPTFALALIGGSGLYLVFRGTQLLWFGDASLQWPSVTGVVRRAYVEDHLAIRGNVGVVAISQQEGGYEVVVEYAYDVKGQTYSSTRWSFKGGRRFQTEAEAEIKARRYREADEISVRYDPADPERSVIRPGGGTEGFTKAITGIVMLLWALYGYLNS